MMKFKLLSILFVSLFIHNNAYGQTNAEMTPYELKRESLAKEALKKMTESMSASDQLILEYGFAQVLDAAGDDRFAKTAAMENLLNTIFDLGDLFKNDAAYLSQSISISTAYSADQVKKWSAIGKWYKEQRIVLEKERTENDIVRENTRTRQSRGIGMIKKEINKRFTQWCTREETEKSAEYQLRIEKNSVAAFDSICFMCCNELAIKNVKLEKDKYDADKEEYSVFWNIIDDSDNVLCTKRAFFSFSPEEFAEYKKEHSFRFVSGHVLKELDVLGVGEYEGYVFPLKVRFKLNNEAKIATFEDVEPSDINFGIITNKEIRAHISGHNFDISEFLSRIVFCDDARAELNSLYAMYEDTYSYWHGIYWTADKYYIKLPESKYIPRTDHNGNLSNFRRYLAEKTYKGLLNVCVYQARPDFENIVNDICSYDKDKVYNDFLEAERQYYINAAKALKDEQLKNNLSQIDIFDLLLSYSDRGISLPREEAAKLFVENNAYLCKKIKVKDSYLHALAQYYNKHQFS